MNQAILLNNNYLQAYNNRAGIFIELGQYENAIQDMSKAISLFPELAPSYMMRMDMINDRSSGVVA